ncbi:MAG: acyl-[acyl-carrier-protein]--UDP-N-acetylglucosamine O-acyltransferase [Candidatus Wallbacteria bacterium HGW-Wallbacteria-1]|jgi:UDP-N-acetylglucosamine acyltransferase|uniref:Acyl-[acyl-carrier-protein]--UDP-N-acetylglucosamine O-acyltransferase n=1 Tax=Candidatus Wallbacteria bacterium HGW-Wallbacteria-1 TaxID=2013854 RepID=A0A2N1PUL0_9BACT|nr:MAG: acyl-[acyl-carrier-protein]--UDP-N-acetylglucosamine O-acyltransferase [Candidatus Wallbacteria bacterium HGW-Wallbacteria-1]
MAVHSTAFVEPGARLGENVEIGPFCSVGADVTIGDGTKLLSHVAVAGRTAIGKNCTIYPFASIGHAPQDLKWGGERTIVTIGDENVIREYVTINSAQGEGETTSIGSGNLLMAYVHVAHNCQVGSNVIMANAATLAGHVHIHDCVVLGGLVGVHQFVKVGSYSMIGGLTKVVQDIAPFTLVDGNPATTHGLNSIGLKRRGFSVQDRTMLKEIYRIFFRSPSGLAESIGTIQEQYGDNDHARYFLDFVRSSTRGIVR